MELTTSAGSSATSWPPCVARRLRSDPQQQSHGAALYCHGRRIQATTRYDRGQILSKKRSPGTDTCDRPPQPRKHPGRNPRSRTPPAVDASGTVYAVHGARFSRVVGKAAPAMTQEKRRKNQPESHVTQKSCLHEPVSAEIGNERIADEPRHHLDTGVDHVHTTFGRTNSRQLLPQAPRSSGSRPRLWKSFAQLMSSPQLRDMK